jgi:hypothetical protein
VFGYPIVKQLRNPHNYFKDHQAERHGLELTEHFCSWLRAIPLKGTTYLDCMVEIMSGIEEAAKKSELVQKNGEFKEYVAGFGELHSQAPGPAAPQPWWTISLPPRETEIEPWVGLCCALAATWIHHLADALLS